MKLCYSRVRILYIKNSIIKIIAWSLINLLMILKEKNLRIVKCFLIHTAIIWMQADWKILMPIVESRFISMIITTRRSNITNMMNIKKAILEIRKLVMIWYSKEIKNKKRKRRNRFLIGFLLLLDVWVEIRNEGKFKNTKKKNY